MLSCSRQVAWDMESRCYPGQSLIWTSASEKTHMTHGVSARKQFAMKSIKWRTQALHKSLFLRQYVVAWIENLRAGEGLTNGLPKQKWGENGRPWTLRQIDITSPTVEQMSAIPCFEAHMHTLYPHRYIEIHKTTFWLVYFMFVIAFFEAQRRPLWRFLAPY